MKVINSLLTATLLFCSVQVRAADRVVVSTESGTTDAMKKVVELHITFPPPPTADVKKQRKAMAHTKTGKAICSGSFISPYGHVITARHCVQDATAITVITSDGQEYNASTRAISKSQDLAVIQIGKFNTPFFQLATPLVQGQQVWIFGSPLGITGTITTGIVARLYGDVTLLDCTALPGNSGGPVIDANGRLAGVVSAIIVVYLGPSHITVVQSLDSIMMLFYELSGGK